MPYEPSYSEGGQAKSGSKTGIGKSGQEQILRVGQSVSPVELVPLQPGERQTATGVYVSENTLGRRLGENRTESGLYVVGNNKTAIQQGERRTELGVYISDPSSVEIYLPNMEETQMIVPPLAKEEEIPHRSSSELALAVASPNMFLAREIQKGLSEEEAIRAKEVIANLSQERKINWQAYWLNKPDMSRNIQSATVAEHTFSKKDTERIVEAKKYFDRQSGEKAEIVSSKPGPLELAAIKAVDVLHDTAVPTSSAVIPILELFRDYGRALNAPELPEMPDLTTHIIEILPHLQNKETRIGLYNLLESIKLPAILKESIIGAMDASRDLDHPLAYKLTLDLAEKGNGSAWIKEMNMRRKKMLALLKGDKQELFNKFGELMKQSGYIVYSGDPLHPFKGKLGMEMECQLGDFDDSDDDQAANNKKRGIVDKSLREALKGDIGYCWRMESDGLHGTEIKKNGHSGLRPSRKYSNALYSLYQWTRSHTSFLKSLHLHLDRQIHPNRPALGNLYFNFSDSFRDSAGNGNDGIIENDLGTWEIRSINIPRSDGNLHPARIEDLMRMYASAAKAKNEAIESPPIALKEGKPVVLEQLIWGHIISYIKDPEGRLACLMALKDKMALRSVNPLAFFRTFDGPSIKRMPEELNGQFKSDEDRNSVRMMQLLITDDVREQSVNFYGKELCKITKVLGKDNPYVPPLMEKLFNTDISYYRLTAIDYFLEDIPEHVARLASCVNEMDYQQEAYLFQYCRDSGEIPNKLAIAFLSSSNTRIRKDCLYFIRSNPEKYYLPLIEAFMLSHGLPMMDCERLISDYRDKLMPHYLDIIKSSQADVPTEKRTEILESLFYHKLITNRQLFDIVIHAGDFKVKFKALSLLL